MNKTAIGVFDSGLGGLTAVRELTRLVPKENIVYFGDTARVPYGNRSVQTITRYARQDIAFLLEQGVKLLIDACGTMSSTLTHDFLDLLPIPYVGVIEPAAKAAAAATKNKKIGVIATAATTGSGAFPSALLKIDRSLKVFSKACPLFVPLVENGYIDRENEVTKAVAKEYLLELRDAGVDTLILGCTHYPLIAPVIGDVMGSAVTLIDSGLEAAKAAVRILKGNCNNGEGELRFFTSDSPIGFSEIAAMFLGHDIGSRVTEIDIEAVRPLPDHPPTIGG